MESGPIGPYLSEIAAVLHRNGYARSTIRRRFGEKIFMQWAKGSTCLLSGLKCVKI
jgi:hypothetical protein